MKNKTLLLVIFGLCQLLRSSAQSRIIYQYDGAGNRVVRKVSVASANAKASPENPNSQDIPSMGAFVGNFSATYSLNGDVTVIDIPQGLPSKTFLVSVYDAKGALLYSTKREKGTSAIPFSKFPKGIYLVSAECENWRQSVKVTKQ